MTTCICQVEVSSFSWLHSGWQEDNLLNAVLVEESQEFIPVDFYFAVVLRSGYSSLRCLLVWF